MNNTVAELKQNINNYEVIGKLEDIRYISPTQSGEIRTTAAGKRYVSGSFLIDTNWVPGAKNNPEYVSNIIKIDFFESETTGEGKPNPRFAEAQEYKNKFKTILTAENPDEASVIRVSGNTASISENTWFEKGSGERVDGGYSLSALFFTEVSGRENKNSFVVEGDVLTIQPKEIDIGNDEVKEIAEVKLIVIGYRGRGEVLTFTAEEPAAVDYILENFEAGQRVKFKGEIVNQLIQTIIEEESAFGPPIQKVQTRSENKLLIKSSTVPVESPIDPTVMNTVMEQREARLTAAEMRAKQQGMTQATSPTKKEASSNPWSF